MDASFLFFHIPYITPRESNYDHCCLALAEGMKELGYTFYGNIDYWKDFGQADYLIRKQPQGYDADVHIYADSFVLANFDRLEQIINPRKVNVLVDSSGFPWLNELGNSKRSDELFKIYQDKRFDMFEYILRSHSIEHLSPAANVHPWAFGLTNRIIKEAAKSYDLPLEPTIISNFRVSLDIRKVAVAQLNPILGTKFKIKSEVTESLDDTGLDIHFESEEEKYYWEHTGRRHRAEFYRTLNSSLLTYTFGGLLDIKSVYRKRVSNVARLENRIMKNLLGGMKQDFSKYILVYQYDSWRIWEAMVSNTCPINMDFNDWGMMLPVLPENGKHYVGVKQLQLRETAEKLLAMSNQEISEIGITGREWALKHYSPKPTTQRFIQLLKNA